MEKDSNRIVINEINRKIEDKERVAPYLMNLLSLSKDAIYRRLRSEVPFTFEEVSKIAYDMEISIDHLLAIDNEKKFLCELKLVDFSNIMENYARWISEDIETFVEMENDMDSKIFAAYNTLPHNLYFFYPSITKFRIYRWLYQLSTINGPMSSFELPHKILELQKEFVRKSKNAATVEFILTSDAFYSFVNDIIYFHNLNLVSKEEMKILKEELLNIIDDLDQLTITGRYLHNAKNILLYISDISLESCYIVYESQKFTISGMRVFSINSILTKDFRMNKQTKEWIVSLKKYATLITQSNEKARVKFILKQRQVLDNLFPN